MTVTPCTHASRQYFKQTLNTNFGPAIARKSFPSIEVLYRKTTDKVHCSSSPGTESPCLDATVSFFNVSDQTAIPEDVKKAQNSILEALNSMVPKYL